MSMSLLPVYTRVPSECLVPAEVRRKCPPTPNWSHYMGAGNPTEVFCKSTKHY